MPKDQHYEDALSQDRRRRYGVHFTCNDNIKKVIEPLFLEGARQKLQAALAKDNHSERTKELLGWLDYVARLLFFDPAAGSGNFLRESYLALKELERQALAALDTTMENLPRVSLKQFWGLELNQASEEDLLEVAHEALDRARQEAEHLERQKLPWIPLKTNEETAHLIEGNALSLDWDKLLSSPLRSQCSGLYIMGNPPFIGASLMTPTQKRETVKILGKVPLAHSVDYAGAWLVLAARLMQKYSQQFPCACAFVLTNSLNQGEQVAPVWQEILYDRGMAIFFAHTTFLWQSQAEKEAGVHCEIVGLGPRSQAPALKKIADSQGSCKLATNISPYLVAGPDTIVSSRSAPPDGLPKIYLGNKPADGGHLILSDEEKKAVLAREPELAPYIRPYLGAREYIKGTQRFCFWLRQAPAQVLEHSPELQRRLEAVRQFRLASSASPTRQKAREPHLFFFISQPEVTSLEGNSPAPYLLIPSTTSHRRAYLPISFCPAEIISSNANLIIPGAGLYHLGVLSSSMHMTWMRTVGGRLREGYRYSNNVIYNTFPWPQAEDTSAIANSARHILEVRQRYPHSSLEQLYDPQSMPDDLLRAHLDNDAAVLAAYHQRGDLDEAERIALLLDLYAHQRQ